MNQWTYLKASRLLAALRHLLVVGWQSGWLGDSEHGTRAEYGYTIKDSQMTHDDTRCDAAETVECWDVEAMIQRRCDAVG